MKTLRSELPYSTPGLFGGVCNDFSGIGLRLNSSGPDVWPGESLEEAMKRTGGHFNLFDCPPSGVAPAPSAIDK